jgi:hypothetical protein
MTCFCSRRLTAELVVAVGVGAGVAWAAGIRSFAGARLLRNEVRNGARLTVRFAGLGHAGARRTRWRTVSCTYFQCGRGAGKP